MRRASLALLLALSLIAACVPPETDPIRRFPTDTALGELQKAGTIQIAIDTNWRPFGTADGERPQGFAVDLGIFVADEMGMEARFIEASTPDEVATLVNGGEADLGFAAFELTEENVRNNSFTDPFFVAHQRLLVPAGSTIEDVPDLEGKRVCEVVDEITGVPVGELVEPVEASEEDEVGTCVKEARRGSVDAVSAPDGLLLPWLDPDGANRDFELAGDEQTTVGWAAITSPELSGLVGHFNDSLTEAKSDGDWARWYARWIEPSTGESEPDPPQLSLEEAAALFPISLTG